jgi:hypothetical protein
MCFSKHTSPAGSTWIPPSVRCQNAREKRSSFYHGSAPGAIPGHGRPGEMQAGEKLSGRARPFCLDRKDEGNTQR